MPTDSTRPNWIEPPPKRDGMGCFGKGCLTLMAVAVVGFLLLMLASYWVFNHGVVASQPTPIAVQELPPEKLAEVQERIDRFENTPPAPLPEPTPMPQPGETPTPAPPAAGTPQRELVMTAEEINGLIAANRKSSGHASVSLSGNSATVRLSVPSDKVPGFPRGYLNGSFVVTTNGPTPLNGLQVSKIRANGYPVPSSILSMNYRGHSILGLALDAASPYQVRTAEIRDGRVILH